MAAQFKRKIKPGLIELDPVDPTIIINFVTQTIDTTQQGEDGKPLVVDQAADTKRLKLKSFKTTSNIDKYADAVQKQSPMIHESKIPHIADLLTQLRQRMLDAGEGDDLSATAPAPMQRQPSAVSGGSRNPPSGNSSHFDLGASAPAGMVPLQRAQSRQREEEEPEQRPAASARPGSASRSRGPRVDTQDGPSAPQSAVSPTFAQQQQQQQQGSNSKSKAAMKATRPPPMTEEEIEAYEAEQELRRQQMEMQQKEQRKMRNMKRAGLAVQQAFEAEQERLAMVDKRERTKRKEASKKKDGVASLKKLDEYMETLYDDDINTKIKGTSLILQLVQSPDNLDHFIDNDTVLGALARVLADDRKKSVELSTNILEIFFCFSSFRQLHPILLQNKIGDTTMKIITLEIDRYELRRQKEETWRREQLKSNNLGSPSAAASNNPEGDVSTHYLPTGAVLSSDEKARVKKLTAFLQSQEKLLFVCFYILLNLAEDFTIELKMKNRKIVKHLVKLLKRTGSPFIEDRAFLDELHLLVLTFLKKLSIFEENKREMKEYEIVKHLSLFIQNNSQQAGSGPQAVDTSNPEILDVALKLLYNLSFDSDLKREVSLAAGGIGGGWVQPKNFGKASQAAPLPSSPTGAVPGGVVVFGGQQFNWERDLNPTNMIVRCVELLRKPNPNVRIVAARVLYNLSSDLNYRPLVERALHPDVSVLGNLILGCRSKLVDRELISLAVNVTWNDEVVDALVTPDSFNLLIKRVHQTFDPLLIKLLRNISQVPAQVPQFKRYLHELVGMTLKAPSHEFLVESIGLLANITLGDVMYSELMAHHGLLDFVMTHLQPGFADDDIVLESLQLLGTLAIDPKAAPMLANAHLIRNLFELLNEKIEDLDIVVQIVFTIFKLLLHRESREAVMMHQHLTTCLLDLVVDPSPEVRHLANMCLDIIMEHDENWRDQIRSKRFEAFNREWLQLVASSASSHAHMQGNHLLPGSHPYDNSLGMHGEDSMDDGMGYGGSYGASHDHDHLGDSGMEQYRQHDDLEDSEDMSMHR